MIKRPPVFPVTYSETIYQNIKQAILSGDFGAEKRIYENEIAKFFNVSLTPVREAIRRLSGEKYLIVNDRKEIIVASASLKEVKELYEVVGFLDYQAIIKAMNHLSSQDMRQLIRMTENLKKVLSLKKANDYINLNFKIHDKIWRACSNEFLYQTLSQLAEKILIYNKQGISPYPEEAALKRSYADHCELLKAMELIDKKALKEIVSRHWYLPY